MNELLDYPWLNWYVSNLRSISGGIYWTEEIEDTEDIDEITISPFRMGATPVTWGIWKEYLETIALPGKGIQLPDDPGWGYPDDHPVVNVSWNDIMDPGGFCEWASAVAGFELTLPTDAQWEYAARGGKNQLEYPWGDDFDTSKLWFSEKQTAAVDRTNRIYRNGYGLTDMVGNVWQWCADYKNDYRLTGKDPVDTEESDYRCIRGAHWSTIYYPNFFRCASRGGNSPDSRYNLAGFRLSTGPK